MLMRTDPFRELDRLATAAFGTPARPASAPMDAYREGESFVIHVDLPGVDPESLDVEVERNVLTLRASRGGGGARGHRARRRRAAARLLQPPGHPRRHPRHRPAGGHLRRRRPHPAGPGGRAGQGPQGPGRQQRRRRAEDHRGRAGRGLTRPRRRAPPTVTTPAGFWPAGVVVQVVGAREDARSPSCYLSNALGGGGARAPTSVGDDAADRHLFSQKEREDKADHSQRDREGCHGRLGLDPGDYSPYDPRGREDREHLLKRLARHSNSPAGVGVVDSRLSDRGAQGL